MKYYFYTDGSHEYPLSTGAWAWVNVSHVDRGFVYATDKTGRARIHRPSQGAIEIELHAILGALVSCRSESDVHIFCDCEAAIHVMNGCTISDRNWMVTQKIFGLTRGPLASLSLSLHKVPRRSDIFAEYADSLASHARKGEELTNFKQYCYRLGEKETI